MFCIERNLRGNSLLLRGLTGKCDGRCLYPVPGSNRSPPSCQLIDRSVEVEPFALHLYLCFVEPPGATHRPGVSLPALLEHGGSAAANAGWWCALKPMRRSPIMATRSRRLNLQPRYQRTHNTAICWSERRFLNSSSAGTNRGIYPSPLTSPTYAPKPYQPHGHSLDQ